MLRQASGFFWCEKAEDLFTCALRAFRLAVILWMPVCRENVSCYFEGAEQVLPKCRGEAGMIAFRNNSSAQQATVAANIIQKQADDLRDIDRHIAGYEM